MTDFIFIGKAGAGKSTLLSSLIGRKGAFESGVSSTGDGVTTGTKKLKDPNYDINWIDIPGTNDPTTAKEAEEGIKKHIEDCMKQRRTLKIVFVIEAVAGRVVDVAFDVNQVMKSVRVPDKLAKNKHQQDKWGLPTKDSYNVIVNKMSAKVSNETWTQIVTKFIQGDHETMPCTSKHVFRTSNDKMIIDEDNELLSQQATKKLKDELMSSKGLINGNEIKEVNKVRGLGNSKMREQSAIKEENQKKSKSSKIVRYKSSKQFQKVHDVKYLDAVAVTGNNLDATGAFLTGLTAGIYFAARRDLQCFIRTNRDFDTSSGNRGTWKFKDEEGDIYSLKVGRKNWFTYSSKQPTIIDIWHTWE